jgi:hypothetical protein
VSIERDSILSGGESVFSRLFHQTALHPLAADGPDGVEPSLEIDRDVKSMLLVATLGILDCAPLSGLLHNIGCYLRDAIRAWF